MVKVVFFEYLGRDEKTANFMKGPSSRSTNIFTALAKYYGVRVITIYSNVKKNAVYNFIDFLKVLLSTLIRLKVGLLRDVEGIYTAQGRSWLAGFVAKLIRPSIIWMADVNDTASNIVATDFLKSKKPHEYYLLQLFKKTILLGADFVVGADYEVDQLIKAGFPDAKVIRMQDGANIRQFMQGNATEMRKRLNLSNRKVILFDGKLLPHYHVERLIIAFVEVKKKFPDSVLLIVGDGPAMGYLKNAVSSLSLEDSVLLIGLQPYSIMPDIVAVADVCALPFPTVGLQLWEWFAAGKIVVSINSENARSHGLRHLENSILVDSEKDLGAGILFALENSAALSSLSSNAALLGKELDWKALVANLHSRLLERHEMGELNHHI
jgi:glycosyltransferase involved in cell wall biosynthesis